MRTLFTLKRFDRNNRLVELREDYSRSFTRGFLSGLYLSHGHILAASALAVADVMGSTTRLVDGDSYQAVVNQPSYKSNMIIAGPAGGGAKFLPGGDLFQPGAQTTTPPEFFAGHTFGIQIGRGNTARTPADARLADRIAHGQNASVGAPAIIDQNSGDTTDRNAGTDNCYLGMVYAPIRSFTLTDVQFKVWRQGNPGNVTVQVIGLTTLTASDRPWTDGSIIGQSDVVNANAWGAASPGALVHFAFSTPVRLEAGFCYFIAITPSQASGGNYVVMRSVPVYYGRSMFGFTNVAGLSHGITVSGNLGVLYILTGTAGAEMEYGSTDICNYVVNAGAGTASFLMRRIFQNNSLEAITVQESGIYFPLCNYRNITATTQQFWTTYMVCAARDTFAGIAVANGESLEVDYTPSITV